MGPSKVIWHVGAIEDRRDIQDKSERTAIDHSARKLEALGPALRYPHQSAVKASKISVRELRPRAGRSRWRALYIRVAPTTFAILAIAPEAHIDRSGFVRGVKRAKQEHETARPHDDVPVIAH